MRCFAIAILFAALAVPALAEKKLTPEELRDLLEKNDTSKIFLLDVREPNELEETGAIKGHVNIPISQLEKRLREVPKNKIIVTYCMLGIRAGRAAEILEKNGFEVFGSCGIVPWKEKGFPTVQPQKK